MDLDKIIKLIKLANHNPNENEANLAARKVCKLIEENNFKLDQSTQQTNKSTSSYKPYTSPTEDWFEQQSRYHREQQQYWAKQKAKDQERYEARKKQEQEQARKWKEYQEQERIKREQEAKQNYWSNFSAKDFWWFEQNKRKFEEDQKKRQKEKDDKEREQRDKDIFDYITGRKR